MEEITKNIFLFVHKMSILSFSQNQHDKQSYIGEDVSWLMFCSSRCNLADEH